MTMSVEGEVVGKGSGDDDDNDKKGGTGLMGVEDVQWMPLDALRHLAFGPHSPLRCLLFMFIAEFAAFGMLIPIIPFFAMHELDCGPKDVGVLLAAFSLSQFVGSSLAGRLSDSIGRYPVIVAAYAWSALGFGCTAFVHDFWQFLIVRVGQGLSGGTNSLSDAYVLDIVPNSQRAAYMGLFGAARGLSFVVGPGCGGLLLKMGFSRRAVFILAGGFGLVATLAGFFYLEESLVQKKRRPLSCGFKLAVSREVQNLDGVCLRGLVCVWICRFLYCLGQGFMFSTHAFLIRDLFGWSDKHFGMILLFAGCTSAGAQFVLFPRVIAKIGTTRTLTLGCFLGACSFVLFPRPFLPSYGIALVCYVFSVAYVEPSLPILVGRLAGELHLGFANGVTGSLRALALAIAPLFAGPLYEGGPSLAYNVGAVILSCGVLAAAVTHRIIAEKAPTAFANTQWSAVTDAGNDP